MESSRSSLWPEPLAEAAQEMFSRRPARTFFDGMLLVCRCPAGAFLSAIVAHEPPLAAVLRALWFSAGNARYTNIDAVREEMQRYSIRQTNK